MPHTQQTVKHWQTRENKEWDFGKMGETESRCEHGGELIRNIASERGREVKKGRLRQI